jgi:catechol 2,3-dioxygenase-like lactoylglutathione lyase family enzyme
MPDQTTCRNTGIHHVGLHAANPAASAEFYGDVFGMEVVGGSGPDHPIGASVFLSSRAKEESHEIALFANPALAHVAFKVSSLAELRSLHARVVEKGIPIKFAFNHGAVVRLVLRRSGRQHDRGLLADWRPETEAASAFASRSVIARRFAAAGAGEHGLANGMLSQKLRRLG